MTEYDDKRYDDMVRYAKLSKVASRVIIGTPYLHATQRMLLVAITSPSLHLSLYGNFWLSDLIQISWLPSCSVRSDKHRTRVLRPIVIVIWTCQLYSQSFRGVPCWILAWQGCT